MPCCKSKPFLRHYDLERHFRIRHTTVFNDTAAIGDDFDNAFPDTFGTYREDTPELSSSSESSMSSVSTFSSVRSSILEPNLLLSFDEDEGVLSKELILRLEDFDPAVYDKESTVHEKESFVYNKENFERQTLDVGSWVRLEDRQCLVPEVKKLDPADQGNLSGLATDPWPSRTNETIHQIRNTDQLRKVGPCGSDLTLNIGSVHQQLPHTGTSKDLKQRKRLDTKYRDDALDSSNRKNKSVTLHLSKSSRLTKLARVGVSFQYLECPC